MPTINLSWTPAGGGATGQKVYRSNDAGVNYSLLATLTATANSYSDTTPTAGDVYFYKVATVCASGDEETLPVDVCADGTIQTPIVWDGITYVGESGVSNATAQYKSTFSFSVGNLAGGGYNAQQHYQVTKVMNNNSYSGNTGALPSSAYSYCAGGWCYGQVNQLDDYITKLDIYFDGSLVQTIQSNVNLGNGLGKTWDPVGNPATSNQPGQFLYLEPKGGSGFSLVVTLISDPGE